MKTKLILKNQNGNKGFVRNQKIILPQGSSEYKYLDSLSTDLSSKQEAMANEYVKKYPGLDLMNKRNKVWADSTFNNTQLNPRRDTMVKELGIDPSIPMSEEYKNALSTYRGALGKYGINNDLTGANEVIGQEAYGPRNFMRQNQLDYEKQVPLIEDKYKDIKMRPNWGTLSGDTTAIVA